MRTPTVKQASSGVELAGGPAVHGFFLDIDGTLLDIADTPDRVSADPQLLDTVRLLYGAAGGALALISGRTVASVDALFAPLRLPIAGQHGAERRDAAGATHYHPHCAGQLEALRWRVTEWAAGMPGLLVEDKGMSLAVHYRQAPQLAGEVRRVLRECVERTGGAFGLQPGKMVLEVRPAGKDKGTAIAEFMSEPPFSGRTPVFVGDDVTDEHGFAVVNHLGGHSVKVGPGPSAARWRMHDVATVRAWLADLLGLSPGPRSGTAECA